MLCRIKFQEACAQLRNVNHAVDQQFVKRDEHAKIGYAADRPVKFHPEMLACIHALEPRRNLA